MQVLRSTIVALLGTALIAVGAVLGLSGPGAGRNGALAAGREAAYAPRPAAAAAARSALVSDGRRASSRRPAGAIPARFAARAALDCAPPGSRRAAGSGSGAEASALPPPPTYQ